MLLRVLSVTQIHFVERLPSCETGDGCPCITANLVREPERAHGVQFLRLDTRSFVSSLGVIASGYATSASSVSTHPISSLFLSPAYNDFVPVLSYDLRDCIL